MLVVNFLLLKDRFIVAIKGHFLLGSNNVDLLQIWFISPDYALQHVENILTRRLSPDETPSANIPVTMIRCLGRQIWLSCQIRTGSECFIGLFFIDCSYLKYLKAVDVQHTHHLVASFGLCLRKYYKK